MLTNLCALIHATAVRAQRKMRQFAESENGAVDFVAIAIILVITVTLAIVFRKEIASLFTKIWSSIGDKTGADFEINGMES